MIMAVVFDPITEAFEAFLPNLGPNGKNLPIGYFPTYQLAHEAEQAVIADRKARNICLPCRERALKARARRNASRGGQL